MVSRAIGILLCLVSIIGCDDFQQDSLTVRATDQRYLNGPQRTPFFSMYIEGSLKNKSLEITNATGFDIDLADYQIIHYVNGGQYVANVHSFKNGLVMKNNSVYVLSYTQAPRSIMEKTDDVASIVSFDGNDALVLARVLDDGKYEPVDAIGEKGVNVGDGWDVAGISEATKNHTLVRKNHIPTGNTSVASSFGTNSEDSEWIVYGKDYIDGLGTLKVDLEILPVVKTDFEGISSGGQNCFETNSCNDLEFLEDEELLSELYNRTKGHRFYLYYLDGYFTARDKMFSEINVFDGQVECVYTGKTIEPAIDSRVAYEFDFNTEHSWPQSQFKKYEPMKSDLHHIFPANVKTNGTRSNYDFGTVGFISDQESGLEKIEKNDARFQVRKSRRGDIARAHFYMVSRYKYETTVFSSTGKLLEDIEPFVFDDNKSLEDGCINDEEEAVLKKWHAEDPVDEMEMERNDRIELYQGNRNPFIDNPELVDRISNF